MKEIILSRGKRALVDDFDYEILSVFKWHCTREGRAGRIMRFSGSRKPITILMHRQILEAKNGVQVDHINMDPLDNRRCNLRLATHSQNNWNRRKSKNNRTGFKGVGFHKASKSYRARIATYGKQVLIGRFATPELAYAAYVDASKRFHGEFARA